MKKLLTVSLLCMCSTHALAAGDKHGKSSGGLPQLDPSSYPSQAFWLILMFVIMYFFFAKKTLPAISQTIENRTERINNDLDTAERLKNEVEAVQKTYEDSLQEARAESAQLFKNIESDVKQRSEKLSSDFQADSVKRIAALEVEISKQCDLIKSDMNDIVAEVASEATTKIIGVPADVENAKSIVKSINKAV